MSLLDQVDSAVRTILDRALDGQEIRFQEAVDMGATEVCMQAGLPPDMKGDFYIELTRSVKRANPSVHIHAFSPEEVLYGATRSGISTLEYLRELKDAGLGSLPGTSA